MIEAIDAARSAAEARIAAASTVDELRALDTELLGKKSALADVKAGLGKLATVEEKKSAGQAVNEAMTAVRSALDA